MKVLVVEEVPFVRQFLVSALRAQGQEPHAFADGMSAWDWFHGHPCLLAILDWELAGGVDGQGLCRWIHQSHPETFALALVGHPTPALSLEATRTGAQTLLGKPPSLEALSKILTPLERRQGLA
jgi:DNA-binding response OmpR family regulator